MDDVVSEAVSEGGSHGGHEQRASWFELFFDLVVVVAVAALAERLHEDPGVVDVLLVLMLYLAVWLVWVSFMLYGNVAGDGMHRKAMIGAMACIAVMAASIPAVHEAGAGGVDRSRVFALAYLVARFLAMNVWRTTSKALVDWPIAQLSVGLTPWIASLWAHGDRRYWLWALGLALDIGFAVMSNDRDRILRMLRRERDHDAPGSDRHRRRGRDGKRAEQAGEAGGAPATEPKITEASVNVSHLDERLGVYMIIVLGEAVSQVVRATSGRDWNGGLARAAFCAFLLLVGLWWLTFQYGFATSPESRLARMPARFGLPLHFLTTASIIFLATGLGDTVSDPMGRLEAGPRWLAAGGLAGYLAVNALAATAIGASAEWLLGWALPTVLLAIGVGALGWALAGWGIALLLLAAVGWQVAYGLLRERGSAARMSGALFGSPAGAGAEDG